MRWVIYAAAVIFGFLWWSLINDHLSLKNPDNIEIVALWHGVGLILLVCKSHQMRDWWNEMGNDWKIWKICVRGQSTPHITGKKLVSDMMSWNERWWEGKWWKSNAVRKTEADRGAPLHRWMQGPPHLTPYLGCKLHQSTKFCKVSN